MVCAKKTDLTHITLLFSLARYKMWISRSAAPLQSPRDRIALLRSLCKTKKASSSPFPEAVSTAWSWLDEKEHPFASGGNPLVPVCP